MEQSVQYITDESGSRVGVLLDIETYVQLTDQQKDPDLLINLSRKELLALSEVKLSTEAQNELSDLLSRNRENTLSEQDNKKLDQILERVDDLNVLRARAAYTLHQLGTSVS